MTRKNFAGWLTRKLINLGELKPEPCESCGKPVSSAHRQRQVQAHHDDYRTPLVIRWLCPSCHVKWHVANGPGVGRDEPHEGAA
jgi:hypothetical protein